MRMKFQVGKPINVSTPQGLINLKEGQIIALSEEEALPMVKAGLIKPLIKVMDGLYQELNQWLRQFDLTADEIKERDLGLYFELQEAIEGLDKAFLEEDLSSFKGFIEKVRELYCLALIRCERVDASTVDRFKLLNLR